MGRKTIMTDVVGSRLCEAERILQKTDARPDVVKIALVFTPCLMRAPGDADARRHLQEYVDQLQRIPSDMFAWVLPTEGLKYSGFEDNQYPGTALVGRVVE